MRFHSLNISFLRLVGIVLVLLVMCPRCEAYEIVPQRHSEPVMIPTTSGSKTPLRLVLATPGFMHREGDGKQ